MLKLNSFDKDLKQYCRNKTELGICIGSLKPKDINDVYKPATETEEEHKPYYTSIIFLADNFDEDKVNELYIEEEIGSE